MYTWKIFHFCEEFALAHSIINAVAPFVLCIPCPPLLSFPFSVVPSSPTLPLPCPSAGTGWSPSRWLHDCALLCSTARNVGQTWQGGCCAMTTSHCVTLYIIQACCASLLFKHLYYAIVYVNVWYALSTTYVDPNNKQYQLPLSCIIHPFVGYFVCNFCTVNESFLNFVSVHMLCHCLFLLWSPTEMSWRKWCHQCPSLRWSRFWRTSSRFWTLQWVALYSPVYCQSISGH